MSDESAPQQIVIVRRRGGEEDGHHGGAWKIAYADFMTAMMAFFLVMWLVNAADKKVLTQVASYFNPLKMSDRVTAEKGIEDMTEGGVKVVKDAKDQASSPVNGERKGQRDANQETKQKDSAGEESTHSVNSKPNKPEGGRTTFSEQDLFNDPYGILEKLAAEAIVEKSGDTVSDAGTGNNQTGGDAFRDPFDPNFGRSPVKNLTNVEGPPADELIEKSYPGHPAMPGVAGTGPLDAPKPEEIANPDVAVAEGTKPEQPQGDAEKAKAGEAEVAAGELQKKLLSAMNGLAVDKRPDITVTVTEEGLLVSLTDQFDFEMFRISSAEPNPQLVVAMKRTGDVLKTMPGPVIVRGHTDGRPFRKGTSDNWQLSSQRALMARYMLVAGGIDEKRLKRVEGYADSDLKVKSDPLAAQNRRIDILLPKKKDGT